MNGRIASANSVEIDPKRHLHCRRTAVNCCIAKGLFDHFVGAGDHRNAE
jgi:hypothetical protein